MTLEQNVVSNITIKLYDQACRLMAQQNAGKLSGNNTLKVNTGNLSEDLHCGGERRWTDPENRENG
ncbi:MAG: hypothetical protein FJY15_07875 [Bacteroidetes bacterium]|nr:hypothetical protein [Bacteroidota bacterium]